MQRYTTLLFLLGACSSTPDATDPIDVGEDVVNNQNNINNQNNANNDRDVGSADTSQDVSQDVQVDAVGADLVDSRMLIAETFDVDQDFLQPNATGWSLLHPTQSVRVSSSGGLLEIVPTATDMNAWYEQFQSPYLYQDVAGDFVAEISVEATNLNDPTTPPIPGYNAAGFVVRDPASQVGSENWIMYNVGAQDQQVPYGVEAKTTVDSMSTLELFNVDPTTVRIRLRVCRIGTAFRYFRSPVADDNWQEVIPNANHDRPDLPATLQVGVMVGTWTAQDMRGAFDWLYVWRPLDQTSCTEAVPL